MHVAIDCPGYGANWHKASREPKVAGDSTALLPEIRRLVREIDPKIPLDKPQLLLRRNNRIGESVL